jgi:hypothetical protein
VGEAGTIGAQHALDVDGRGMVCGAAFAVLLSRKYNRLEGVTLRYNAHAFLLSKLF